MFSMNRKSPSGKVVVDEGASPGNRIANMIVSAYNCTCQGKNGEAYLLVLR